MADCINALKQWTGKSKATLVFDSTIDEFTGDGLFNKVRGKRNIAIVGFTTDGDVFGVFFSVPVTKFEERFYDPNIFAFSFESHGRCATPQRFAVKAEMKENAYLDFWKNDTSGFVVFWVFGKGGFYLGNESSESDCWNVSDAFEGLEDTTLTGKNGTCDEGPFHHCVRLIAVQLE